MEKRRRAASSANLRYALIAAAGAGLGAAAMTTIMHAMAPQAIASDAVPRDQALSIEDRAAIWPLPDGGFIARVAAAPDSDNTCVISRHAANGERLWSQHLPAACIVRGVDAGGGTWVDSRGLFRLAPDGSAFRVDDRAGDAGAEPASARALPTHLPVLP